MNAQKILLSVVGILLAFGAVIIVGSVLTGDINWNLRNNDFGGGIGGDGVACTMEAMECPDGSYVGRTGPNCEFAACPGGKDDDIRPMPPEPSPLPPDNPPMAPRAENAAACERVGGTWGPYNECLGIDGPSCTAIGGAYDECASACRHDPDATMCTMQCVQVCSFPQGGSVEITSFKECEAAGYPIIESYPRQCSTPGGKHFVEEIE
jgi:hypothetical protein